MDVGRGIARLALGTVGPQGCSASAQRASESKTSRLDHDCGDAARGQASRAGNSLRPGGVASGNAVV